MLQEKKGGKLLHYWSVYLQQNVSMMLPKRNTAVWEKKISQKELLMALVKWFPLLSINLLLLYNRLRKP